MPSEALSNALAWIIPIGVVLLIVGVYCCVRYCDKQKADKEEQEYLEKKKARKEARLAAMKKEE